MTDQQEATAQKDISKVETKGEETPSVALKQALNSQSMRKKGYWWDPQTTGWETAEMLPKNVVFCKGDNNFWKNCSGRNLQEKCWGSLREE